MSELNKEFECPMMQFVTIISGKWAIPILYRLIQENKALRFSELAKCLYPITQRELSKHLRNFVNLGLVERHYYSEIPPRVEYQITELGLTLKEPLSGLNSWMVCYGKHLSN